MGFQTLLNSPAWQKWSTEHLGLVLNKQGTIEASSCLCCSISISSCSLSVTQPWATFSTCSSIGPTITLTKFCTWEKPRAGFIPGFQHSRWRLRCHWEVGLQILLKESSTTVEV